LDFWFDSKNWKNHIQKKPLISETDKWIEGMKLDRHSNDQRK